MKIPLSQKITRHSEIVIDNEDFINFVKLMKVSLQNLCNEVGYGTTIKDHATFHFCWDGRAYTTFLTIHNKLSINIRDLLYSFTMNDILTYLKLVDKSDIGLCKLPSSEEDIEKRISNVYMNHPSLVF